MTTNPPLPVPALGELARLATADVEELHAAAQEYEDSADVLDTPALEVYRVRRRARAKALRDAAERILQLVALASGGGAGAQQGHAHLAETEKNQPQAPELQHESPTATSEGIAMTSTAALPTSTEILASFDARDWARHFLACAKANPSIPTSEATMTTWFANALMRGYDEHAWRTDAARSLASEHPAEEAHNG